MRVLYVDDDETNRAVIRAMLARSGIDMAEAPDAETGLWMVAAHDYDLVLMDVRMPGMDGMSAIREIRSHEDGKQNVPIIVVTADNAYDIRMRSKAAGADDVLLKPVSMEALFEAIGRVVTNVVGGKAMIA
jgi:CheY-like chemotaxis protein